MPSSLEDQKLSSLFSMVSHALLNASSVANLQTVQQQLFSYHYHLFKFFQILQLSILSNLKLQTIGKHPVQQKKKLQVTQLMNQSTFKHLTPQKLHYLNQKVVQ